MNDLLIANIADGPRGVVFRSFLTAGCFCIFKTLLCCLSHSYSTM